MSITLEHPDVQAHINELSNGKRSISVQPLNDSIFIPIQHCQTFYPLELIRLILNMKGAYLCDEIMREENPSYVHKDLKEFILTYVEVIDFENKRVLDFGCGCGGSTVILAKMFPSTRIVGIDLVSGFLSIAKARAKHYGIENVEFRLSLNGEELPKDIGHFDYVIMSGVYEHLLPSEREPVLSQIWSVMKPGGIMFISKVPNRFFPIEKHTTGIPLLNFLPGRIAFAIAHRFSERISADDSWEVLLRRGIRGGTEQEIMNILYDNYNDSPTLLRPGQADLRDSRDSIDVWYKLTPSRYQTVKRLLKFVFKGIYSITGIAVVPYHLSLAIKKNNGY